MFISQKLHHTCFAGFQICLLDTSELFLKFWILTFTKWLPPNFFMQIFPNLIFNPSLPVHFRYCIEMKKLTWLFIFTLLCGASKGFMKAFIAFIKLFDALQRCVKIRIALISSLSPGENGTGRVKQTYLITICLLSASSYTWFYFNCYIWKINTDPGNHT